MHFCLEFLAELLMQPLVRKQIFAIQLGAQLIEKYPTVRRWDQNFFSHPTFKFFSFRHSTTIFKKNVKVLTLPNWFWSIWKIIEMMFSFASKLLISYYVLHFNEEYVKTVIDSNKSTKSQGRNLSFFFGFLSPINNSDTFDILVLQHILVI